MQFCFNIETTNILPKKKIFHWLSVIKEDGGVNFILKNTQLRQYILNFAQKFLTLDICSG